MTSADWQIYDYYAGKVRSVGIMLAQIQRGAEGPTRTVSTEGFYQSLNLGVASRANSDAPFLPNLLQISLSASHICDLQGAITMIRGSRRLESITFDAPIVVPSQIWKKLLLEIKDCGVHLRELEIFALNCSDTPDPPNSNVWSLLVDLLEHLEISKATLPYRICNSTELLSRIGHLPSLHVLALEGDDSRTGSTHSLSPPRHFRQFDAPRRLDATPSCLQYLYSSEIVFRNLTKLTMRGWGGDSIQWGQIRRTLVAVGVSCPALQILLWADQAEGELTPGEGDDVVSSTSAICPLRHCTELRQVTLDFEVTMLSTTPCDFNPTDQDWADCVGSWPKLEHVSYNCAVVKRLCPSLSSRFQLVPRATLQSLSYFAQHCKHLVSINIPVQATVTLRPIMVARFSPTLQCLELLTSWIDDNGVGPTARFLAKVIRDTDANVVIPTFTSQADVIFNCDLEAEVEEAKRCRRWQRALEMMHALGE
ncbi:hypothetical protein FRB93_008140 [Tulasnella sp. JGI-2019a]|nr:hypothetical protein FRB93_008140 [Tulasnella sp. JGI-2019a]